MATIVVVVGLAVACSSPVSVEPSPSAAQTPGEPTPQPPSTRMDHLRIVAEAQSTLEVANAALLTQYPSAFVDEGQTDAYFTALVAPLGAARDAAAISNPAPELAAANAAYVDALDALTESITAITGSIGGDVSGYLQSAGVTGAFDDLQIACVALQAAGGSDSAAAGLGCHPLRP